VWRRQRSDKSGEPTPIVPVKCAKQIEKFGNNDRVNVGKINNGTCVVLFNIIQHFFDKTNPLETLQPGH